MTYTGKTDTLLEIYKRKVHEYQSIPFNYSLDGVKGWMHPAEEQILYAISRTTPGPFLEIGPWVGAQQHVLPTASETVLKRKSSQP